MSEVFDKIKNAASNIKKSIDAGNQETTSLGNELAERAKMNRAALGQPEPAAPAAPATPTAKPSPVDKVNRPPAKGEKRISDADLKEWTKPLGSYKKGTPSVPKTGIYKLHEGEKVTPAEENPDNPANSNPVEDAVKHSPKEKAHFHRAMSHLNEGGLHRHLGIPEDQDIPMEKKQEAANSDNPHVAAMGHMAVAMHSWNHKHGKK